MLKDCDYVKTENNDFYIIKGYFHPNNYYYATKVFEVNESGNRLNSNGLRYCKVTKDEIVELPQNQVTQVFQPEKSPVKNSLTNVWKDIYSTLLEMGIDESKIGIFGSSLIGFAVTKDVDFILYGIAARNLLHNQIHLFEKQGFGQINQNHIIYQAQKYSRSHNPLYSNFEALLQNKWSGLQITPEILSTIRFAFDNESEVPHHLRFNPPKNKPAIEVPGKVIDDKFVDYTPRVFTIQTKQNQQMDVKTLYWSYQSCVTNGDLITTRGVTSGNTVYVTDYDHGIYSHSQKDKT